MGFLWIDEPDETTFNGINLEELSIDEAYVLIENLNFHNNTYLYGVYTECYQCPYTRENVKLMNGTSTIINTHRQKLWRISLFDQELLPQSSKENILCELNTDFQQFGVYKLEINDSYCGIQTLKEPVNIYGPILSVFLIYFVLYLLAYSAVKVYYVWFKTAKQTNKSTSPRILSIDTFRGISIVLMIFANYGSGSYTTLDHAVWNGLNLADLVFPWFIWIMGFCIPLSIKSAKSRGISTKNILVNIIRRSCILFLLGVVLSSPITLNTVRIPGILQRFGACYLVVATSYTLLVKDDVLDQQEQKLIKLKDIVKLKYVWIVGLLSLIIHLILTFSVSATGCPRGYLGPGGLHQNAQYYNCTGGATGYIDKLIFGNHIYQNPEIKTIYQASSFDPEGILGFFTSIFHVIIGVQAGVTLQTFKHHNQRLIRWIIWGISTGILGGALCGFSKENGLIPINKSLWSISFVFVTCCLSFLLLSVIYWIIDVKKWWNGKPFSFCGMNAILLYVGHNMTYGIFPIRWIPPGGLTNHFLTLLENVWGVSIWILIAYYCYKIKWFLTV